MGGDDKLGLRIRTGLGQDFQQGQLAAWREGGFRFIQEIDPRRWQRLLKKAMSDCP